MKLIRGITTTAVTLVSATELRDSLWALALGVFTLGPLALVIAAAATFSKRSAPHG
jgi:hypothetical protein